MKMIKITISEQDLGQIIDGLEVRQKSWLDTAEFLRSGCSADDFFVCEECTDEEEAQHLADTYERILTSLIKQSDAQRKGS